MREGCSYNSKTSSSHFHLIDRPKFPPLAFKLNRRPHFAARIPTGHILSAGTDTACWLWRTHVRNKRFCFWGKLEVLIPHLEGVIRHLHDDSLICVGRAYPCVSL